MNEKIAELLGNSEEPMYLYASAYIKQLQTDIADMKAELELYKAALKEANKPNDEARRVIEEQGCRIAVRDNAISDLRNELCLKCGKYKTAHEGSCDNCRWRGKA